MTDGTTATQVSPVEDADMNAIRQVFEKAMNSIVSASQLAKVVADLEHRVNDLVKSTEDMRRQNAWLDESLTKVRQERDEANRHINELTTNLLGTERERDTLLHRNDTMAQRIVELEDSLAQVRKERDDYGMKHMEASEALDKAHKAMATIKDALGAIATVQEAKPEMVSLKDSDWVGREPANDFYKDQPKPPVDPDPVPVTKPEPVEDCDFTKPYRWDAAVGRYVNTI